MNPVATWLVIGPIALVCLTAAGIAVGKALGARSLDYPAVKHPRYGRSNYARSVGGHNNLRKVTR